MNPSADAPQTLPLYPAGAVRALLDTPYVTAPTRDALTERIEADAHPDGPQFFTPDEWQTLTAVCARLLPPDAPGVRPESVAAAIDKRLRMGDGDGWRYDALPPDGDAFRQGLRAINETAQGQHSAADFAALAAAEQDALLRALHRGEVGGAVWADLPPMRFFEELLAEVVEHTYSNPLVQETIGYVGMADGGGGWKRIGLNMLDDREPRPHAPAPAVTPPPASDAPRVPTFQTAGSAATDAVDVVVIGTGAGGAPLLMRLARAGFRVVALEAGNQWNPATDFATDERAQSKLFWRDERLSAGGNAVAFGNNNSGVGVGGSTLHFTAYTPRPHADDFRLFSDFGVGRDWPLSYADLLPYIAQVEQFLGVSGPETYPWEAGRTYPLGPLPLNGAAQLMERGCRTLGIRTSPAPNAALSQPYYQEGVGWRAACTNRGFCQAGCSVGAKGSTDVTFIPVAVGAGAQVRPGCFVTEIETDTTGRVRAVVYTQDGQTHRQECRAVFLCAGAVETPRLLLLNGLANGSGQVGRNFMAHPGLQLWAQFDEDIRPYKAIPGGLISEDTHRPADADFAGGYLLQSIGVMPVTYASQLARGTGKFGADLDAHMKGYNHVAGINILGDCLPYDGNFLELSDEKDARGLPKPRVHFTAGENEKRMVAHADRTMRAIWEAAGSRRESWAFDRYAHTIGTCRMGTGATDSVVNVHGAVWDTPGLYICDNSVFPSALSVNPALTLMALSLRLANQFIIQARRGEV